MLRRGGFVANAVWNSTDSTACICANQAVSAQPGMLTGNQPGQHCLCATNTVCTVVAYPLPIDA